MRHNNLFPLQVSDGLVLPIDFIDSHQQWGSGPVSRRCIWPGTVLAAGCRVVGWLHSIGVATGHFSRNLAGLLRHGEDFSRDVRIAAARFDRAAAWFGSKGF